MFFCVIKNSQKIADKIMEQNEQKKGINFETFLKEKLNNSADLICRKIDSKAGEIMLFYFKSTTDKTAIAQEIIEPILEIKEPFDFSKLKGSVICSGELTEIKPNELVDYILKNQVVVGFNDNFLAVDLEKYPTRTPQEPPTSPNIYGPREGFVEAIGTNISLIRKRLQSPNLVVDSTTVGRESRTKVSIIYLKNVADEKVVRDVTKRIQGIDIDGVVDSYYIAQFLKSKPNSMFEQVGIQEKPDIVSAKVLEGRVAVVVDGSPMVLTVPFMLFEDLQSSNDYYTNHSYVNMVRIIRTIGVILATIIPGLYLAIRLYSDEVIPLNYIIVISNSTKNLPFTPVLEMIFIIMLFQILYEVSLRLPQYLGLATSIVGALILGDTGVKAGLISPPGVIIVAVSIMAIYTIPSQASQLTTLRAVFLILGATVGIFGIVAGMVYVINYINTLNEYSTPYLAPFAPRVDGDLKDGIFKKNVTQMQERPKSIPQKNKTRMKSGGKDEK